MLNTPTDIQSALDRQREQFDLVADMLIWLLKTPGAINLNTPGIVERLARYEADHSRIVNLKIDG